MGSIPLDRKGLVYNSNGEFLLGVLSRRYTGDRLIKNEKNMVGIYQDQPQPKVIFILVIMMVLIIM